MNDPSVDNPMLLTAEGEELHIRIEEAHAAAEALRQVTLTTSAAAPGVADGDYTAAFLEAGTTFSLAGVVNAADVPVSKAYVRDGRLYVEGRAVIDLSES